jgi:hypothetical protein
MSEERKYEKPENIGLPRYIYHYREGKNKYKINYINLRFMAL